VRSRPAIGFLPFAVPVSTRTAHLPVALMGGVAVGARAAAAGASALDAGLSAAFGATFVWLALHDAATRIVPNRVVYPAAALALALSWGWDARGPVEALVGGALAFGGLAGIVWLTNGGVGGGDLKMGALVGLVVGHGALPLVALVTAISGGIAALVLLTFGRVSRSGSIAYAPFIALGAIVALLR